MQARYEKDMGYSVWYFKQKRKIKSIPDTMTINGQDCQDKQIIAEQFNSFFTTIGELNVRNYYIRKQ